MAKTRFTRREILETAGWGALLLWPVLRARVAKASAGSVRFVTFYYGNGPSRPTQEVIPAATATGFDWSRAVASAGLRRHESYLSIARGLRLNGDVNPSVSPHQAGSLCWSTGATGLAGYALDPTGEYFIGEDMSVDQWFANATGTRKLYLAVGDTANRYVALSASGPDLPSVPEQDPQRAYDAAFGSFMGMDVGDRRLAAGRRLQVLDVITQDLRSARARFGLSAEERDRLQRYEATLAAAEARLRTDAGGGSPTVPPPRPTATTGSAVPERTRALMDITVAVLALGVHRSVAFQLSSAYDRAIDYSRFVPGASTAHHASQHGIGGATGDPALVTPWVHDQLGYLLDGMRAVTEADGANLLDNSVVMAGTDTPQGRASHDFRGIDHPTFVFGKAAGRLRGGVAAPAPASGARDYVDLLATVTQVLADGAGVANPYTSRPGFRSLVSELVV